MKQINGLGSDVKTQYVETKDFQFKMQMCPKRKEKFEFYKFKL